MPKWTDFVRVFDFRQIFVLEKWVGKIHRLPNLVTLQLCIGLVVHRLGWLQRLLSINTGRTHSKYFWGGQNSLMCYHILPHWYIFFTFIFLFCLYLIFIHYLSKRIQTFSTQMQIFFILNIYCIQPNITISKKRVINIFLEKKRMQKR